MNSVWDERSFHTGPDNDFFLLAINWYNKKDSKEVIVKKK
ncbi:hypothetical protein MY9_2038 [Bacillus sp. JS]|nr:hypothetical protein MY9_2038 [Bacillus sp. JS]